MNYQEFIDDYYLEWKQHVGKFKGKSKDRKMKSKLNEVKVLIEDRYRDEPFVIDEFNRDIYGDIYNLKSKSEIEKDRKEFDKSQSLNKARFDDDKSEYLHELNEIYNEIIGINANAVAFYLLMKYKGQKVPSGKGIETSKKFNLNQDAVKSAKSKLKQSWPKDKISIFCKPKVFDAEIKELIVAYKLLLLESSDDEKHQLNDNIGFFEKKINKHS